MIVNWQLRIDEIKTLFYQCRFRQVVETVDRGLFELEVGETAFQLVMIKSQALYEMHQVPEAKALLREVTIGPQSHTDSYLYVMAKLCYCDENYEKAERLFKLLAERSESVKDFFKANLGLANVYYSLKRYGDLQRIVPEIEEIGDLVSPDERLSFLLLKANYHFFSRNSPVEAKKLFYEVIRESNLIGWSYFKIKAMFGLALMAKERGRVEELETLIQILTTYLNPEETIYLNYQVNEWFKDANMTLASPLQFDAEFKRINVRGSWIPLHDKPLIYRFLETLNSSPTFVSKERIAMALWEEEGYKPRVHDPRIFDLARRIRTMIEPYENQPVCLLSGRNGYKLAVAEAGFAEPSGGAVVQNIAN